MVKSVGKRFLSIALVIVMVLTLLPVIEMPASAADDVTITTGVTGLTAESSGAATWKASDGTITGIVKPKENSGCTGTSYSAQTGTLMFTNNSGAVALLSFDYIFPVRFGSATIAGGDASGISFSKKLEAGDTVEVTLTSGADQGANTSISITNLKLTAEKNVDITFKAPANGSYTVDGAKITAETVKTVATTDSVVLAATPASGYKFFGWYNVTADSYFAFTASVTTSFTEDTLVEPRFVPNSAPIFQVGSMLYTDLNEAAQSSGDTKIVLISNGTLVAGNYTIPSGKTLLIPFDAANTMYTTRPYSAGKNSTMTGQKPYRTLTLAEGATITVDGALNVSAKHASAAGGNRTGGTTGPYGQVKMSSGSSIVVNDGAALYAYGYVSGVGTITANSGSKVHEYMQFADWMGGTNATNIVSSGAKIFPFTQYYVQNIEATLVLCSGAIETVHSSLSGGGNDNYAEVDFFGTKGMFNTSGSLTKRYDVDTDRLIIDVDGDSSVNSLSVSTSLVNVDSKDFILPINSNITINIHSGTTTTNQDIALLPSAEINIDHGASVNIGSGTNCYIYDVNEWGPFTFGGKRLINVGYTTAGTANLRTGITTNAVVDVNGELIVNGNIFTTQSGASIVSSQGTGVTKLNKAAPGDSNTHQWNYSTSEAQTIPVTAAKLQNGTQYAGTDDAYYPTAYAPAGTEIPYSKLQDKWGVKDPIGQTYTVTWLDEDGTPLQESEVVAGEHPIYDGATPTKPEDSKYTYTFDKWKISETDEEYTDATVVTGDLTLYPEFTAVRKTLTVTFHANNGTDATATQTMNTVESTPLNANIFTYKNHVFLGWSDSATGEKVYNDAQPVEFDGNADLYAVWQRTAVEVTFNANAEDAQGTMPVQTVSVNGGELAENAFSRTGYDFIGWNTKADGSGSAYADKVTFNGDEDITLYAQWEIKTYTIRFVDENGDLIGSEQTVEYGKLPTTPAAPEKAADAQYTYAFNGWSPAIEVATKDATYTATYSSTLRNYTITWKDDEGNVIDTTTVAYGATPTHDNPSKAADAQYTYTFKEWSPAVTAVTGDAEYIAVFETTVNKYTVKFVNDDGTVLQSSEVEYGTVPAYDGGTPTKDSTAQHDYTFAGWDKEPVAVTGDATYTATYTSEVRSYTITWVIDGETETETLAYGETPSHAKPSKAADAQYTYSFKEWSPAITEVTGDATYTAVFDTTVNKYTVKFLNEDGSEAKSETLDYGAAITAPADSVKPNTHEKVYTFLGWFDENDVQWSEGATVTGEATYTARFGEADQLYTVVWLDANGEQLKKVEGVLFNAIPEYDGETPVKEADAQYTYEFANWSDSVLDEATFTYTLTPVFDATPMQYTVTFVIDGEEHPVPYLYGEIPAYDGTPEKSADAQYTYTFKEWSPAITAVTGDATYTAVFDKTLNNYTVTWSIDGEEMTETYAYGTTPSHADPVKDATAQYTYTFKGWSPAITEVTDDVIYTAVFEETLNSYTVVFTDEDGTQLDSKTVAYGETPSTDVVPAKADTLTKTYAFAGWTPELAAVTGDVTYTASYTEAERSGWVSFDGKLYFITDGTPVTGIARLSYPDDAFGYVEDPEAVNDAGYPNDSKGTFIFGEDGALQSEVNGFYTFETENENAKYKTDWLIDGSTVWVVNGEIPWHPGEIKVDGDYYYFASANTMIKGRDYNVTRVHDLQLRGKYTFSDEGKIMMYDGITNVNGKDYYYVNGVKTYAGLVKVGDDMYYINSACEVVKGRDYYVSKTNGLLPAGKYSFDDTGKLIVNAPTLNGIVKESETDWYYYVDGVKAYAGLLEIDGSLYYVNSAFQVVHGRDYYVSKTNGLKPQGVYTFDEEGKLVEKDTTLNGIVKDGDTWYYYVDGVKTYAGLVEIDGDLYYVKTDKTVVHGQEYYISKTNGLKDAGKYTFDANGKLVDLNGIVKDGDIWIYYVDGNKTYAGLIEIDGDLYYVKSDCTVVHGQDYYVSKTNGLKESGKYSFAADGKLVQLDGIVKNGDDWTYYVNGAKTYAGLIEIDGDYYYVKSDCTVVHGRSYYVSKTNGLKEAGTYTFDEEGKMS